MNSYTTVVIFCAGWLLFVAGQAHNSVRSSSNGLAGWSGFMVWLRFQAVNLVTRAFFSALAYSFIIHTIATKIQAAGFPVTSTTVAGIGGWAANGLLYQFFGLFPFLRVELSELAPPEPQAGAAGAPGSPGGP